MAISKYLLPLLGLFWLTSCNKSQVTGPADPLPPNSMVTASGHLVSKNTFEMKSLRGSGPFIRLKEGSLLTILSGTAKCSFSKDEGKTWTDREILDPKQFSFASPVVLQASNGTLLMGFSNSLEKTDLAWNNNTHDFTAGSLPTWAARSLDGGMTWQDVQKLHDDWTGMNRDIKELKNGQVIFTSQMMRHNPGRNVVVTYRTMDNGKSWIRSSVVDIGGSGTHGGAMESTLEVLKDGRLWMLLRTNLGCFWQTFSDDGGLTWNTAGATSIDASTSPGALKRLSSGRLALVWNRKYPEGLDWFPMLGGDGNLTEVPSSWQRDELSFSLSDDEGKSWSAPVVIAKNYPQMTYIAENVLKRMLAYPFIFEARPGVLWITTGYGALKINILEEDYTGKKSAQP